MQTFTIALDYKDVAGKPLQLFIRFARNKKLCHVGQRRSATQFLTREDAEQSLPSGGYHVDPRAKPPRAKKGSKGKGKSK